MREPDPPKADTGDQHVLICGLTYSEPPVIPGSEISHCEGCGAEIYLAPTGRQMLQEKRVSKIVCVKCGLRSIKSDPDPQIQQPTWEQLMEIESALRKPE